MVRNTVKVASFNSSVNMFVRAIRAAAKRNGGFVSSVDLKGLIPSVAGPGRGAVVRRAFATLVNDNTLRIVRAGGKVKTIYNAETHHRVTVYALRKTSAKKTTKTPVKATRKTTPRATKKTR